MLCKKKFLYSVTHFSKNLILHMAYEMRLHRYQLQQTFVPKKAMAIE
ncbi:UNVERIFIED_CONTAM: hypothetical protein NCL1_62456 [Trichonephila clavipes]